MAVIDHAPQAVTLGITEFPARKPGTPIGAFDIGDPAPGVDVVMAMPHDADERLLDRRTLKLIGSLHRRFWDRRRDMLTHRARRGDGLAETAAHVEAGSVAVDLRDPRADTWDRRIGMLSTVASLVDEAETLDSRPRVAIRGWDVTESGVLVDGRAVPGAIFDLAVTISLGAESFRREQDPFDVLIPKPADNEEAQLWSDLIDLAHDRAGVDRGTVAIFAA